MAETDNIAAYPGHGEGGRWLRGLFSRQGLCRATPGDMGQRSAAFSCLGYGQVVFQEVKRDLTEVKVLSQLWI